MATCDLYKNGRLLGAGEITNGSDSVTSYTARNDGQVADIAHTVFRKNLQVTITSSTHAGSTFNTRVIADDLAGTLTLMDAMPFAT